MRIHARQCGISLKTTATASQVACHGTWDFDGGQAPFLRCRRERRAYRVDSSKTGLPPLLPGTERRHTGDSNVFDIASYKGQVVLERRGGEQSVDDR